MNKIIKPKKIVAEEVVAEKKQYDVAIVRGVAGLCIYINSYRVVGEKPWGGGDVIFRGWITQNDWDNALKNI